MRIIYIVNARIPTEKAHGYQIGKMSEEFARAGVGVELWVPTRKNPIKEDAFSFYGLERNFKIRYIKCFDFIALAKYLGRIALYGQLFWFLAKLFFIKIDKDILIYTRNPEIAWLYKLRGYKTVYECHQWFSGHKRMALFFLQKCDYIITTNNYIKNEFIKHGFDRNRILAAPNGINLAIFNLDIDKEQALEKLDAGDEVKSRIKNNKVLMYTGGYKLMGVDKGIDEILQALKIFGDRGLHFVAVGGNSEDIKYYRNLSRELGVEKQCAFLPRVIQKELALWQKCGDIMLMPFPRKAHYEFFMAPLKMFEYMASNRPIIASNLPSIKEVLNNGNAFFVKPGNADDLAEKIKYVLEHRDEAKKRAGQAYEDARQYAWNKRAERIINFIN